MDPKKKPHVLKSQKSIEEINTDAQLRLSARKDSNMQKLRALFPEPKPAKPGKK